MTRPSDPHRHIRLLVGTWICTDGMSDVAYTIKYRAGKITVTGIDGYDGEKAEIQDVAWVPRRTALRFSAHWPSTGRFVKYEFKVLPDPLRVGVSYTYSAQEIWEKA